MSNKKQSSVDKEFVPYEEAVTLKKLGFDEPCFGYYENNVFIFQHNSKQEYGLPLNCSAPTFSQAFRWFRERGYENWTPHNEEGYQFVIKWEFEHSGGIEALRKINSHEEAELACLRKLIEIVKGGK